MDIKFVLNVMLQEMSKVEVNKLLALSLIDFLKYSIKYTSAKLTDQLATCAEVLMKCLNPNKPELRKFCQKLATATIHSMLKKFHYSAFHQNTQHIFLPNELNEIVIFDLRTALRWKSLKGHNETIVALAIEEDGNLVASFSYKDKVLKVWKLGSEGFFEQLIRRSAEEWKTKMLTQQIPSEFKYHLKLEWINKKKLKLSHTRSKWFIEIKL